MPSEAWFARLRGSRIGEDVRNSSRGLVGPWWALVFREEANRGS